MANVARFFVGIDLHQATVCVSVLDGQGAELEYRVIRGEGVAAGRKVLRHLGQWAQTGRMAVEAMGMNRWLVDGLRELGCEVVVVDPRKLDLKMVGKKTDRRDAYEIARRLWLGDIDRNARTYYPEPEEYGLRRLNRSRTDLVKQRLQVSNQIRSVFRAHRKEVPTARLWTQKGLAWLTRCRVGTAAETLTVHAYGRVLATIEASIRELTEVIEKQAEEVPYRQVAELPQSGPQTAVTLLSELGDLERFQGSRAVAAYVGLAPRVSQSGEHTHLGRLTRRGNRHVRRTLGQMAVRLLARDPMVMRWAEPKLRRMSKNKVRMALARRLLVGMVVALRREEPFSMRLCLGL